MLMFAGQTFPRLPAIEPSGFPSTVVARFTTACARRSILPLVVLMLVLTGLAAGALPAQAWEFRNGDTVTVPAGTTIDDDLFATGQSVTIAGQVNGEVYALGQTVTVTGAVQRDLIAAGQQVTLDGTV